MTTSDWKDLSLLVAGILGILTGLWLLWKPKRLDAVCKHSERTSARWTQDGWVSICLKCGEWIYLGDDDGPNV